MMYFVHSVLSIFPKFPFCHELLTSNIGLSNMKTMMSSVAIIAPASGTRNFDTHPGQTRMLGIQWRAGHANIFRAWCPTASIQFRLCLIVVCSTDEKE